VTDNPLVSVVITNYNYAHFLPACLDSVLGQTHRNLEVIVVDDGSTDDSRDVLLSYGDRIRAIFQSNARQAAAMSRGVSESKGEIICLLDCDDGWEPHKVQRVIEVMRSHPQVGWVRNKARMVDGDMMPLGQVTPTFSGSGIVPADPALFMERVITVQPSCLSINRDVARQVFPLVIPPNLQFDADDAVLLAKIFATRKAGYSLDEVLGFYRRHTGERFGAHDIPGLLRREADVTAALPAVFKSTKVPSAAYKLEVILGALDGAHWWETQRIRPLARGLAAAASLRSRPRLMLRQATAVMFAYAAPKLWLRKLARSQSWAPPGH
jgi:glycosyltransferase involved in cell wall biosynthesis